MTGSGANKLQKEEIIITQRQALWKGQHIPVAQSRSRISKSRKELGERDFLLTRENGTCVVYGRNNKSCSPMPWRRVRLQEDRTGKVGWSDLARSRMP